ncbi:MAG TPA: serine/threonine-protein kinase, partial [Trebonia sp.]|nr:serine/threonine-protein kinase [Trebonia sp.]
MEPLSAEDPRTIGEFRLHARLGAGGMGQVFLGFSPAGRAVAIKIVHSQFARDQEFLQRFSREVAAASAVSGMYTAPVVGSGLNDNPPWLATAFVPGPPLAAVVGKYGPVPEAATWRLAAGLAEALSAVHAVGLVHRDLKPANVLLADDGPHVIDFGISRAFQGTQLTSAGMVIGTPGYMSPEQAEGLASGPPSDIFSLGCVLAYTATGSPPFGEGTAASVLYRVVRSEPDLSAVPAGLRQVIEACLKKNPAERPDPAQLIGLISAYGPATAATLGSFWPESVARVIAAEQASQTPAGLTPPPAAPAPFIGSSGMYGATQTSGPGGLFGPASGAAPAPAERTPTALATPSSGQASGAGGVAGGTMHAPMMRDGYYAAAAQPRPAPPGPSIPPLSPAPYAAGPYTGQPPAGPGTPATPYPGYSGQQGAPSGWSQPPSGGGAPWPANGTPSGPGGDALAAYRPGSRNPGSRDIPGPVHTALRLMYAGFVATLASLVTSGQAYGRYSNAATAAARHPLIKDAANSMAGWAAIALCADAIGLVCWVVLAVAC